MGKSAPKLCCQSVLSTYVWKNAVVRPLLSNAFAFYFHCQSIYFHKFCSHSLPFSPTQLAQICKMFCPAIQNILLYFICNLRGSIFTFRELLMCACTTLFPAPNLICFPKERVFFISLCYFLFAHCFFFDVLILVKIKLPIANLWMSCPCSSRHVCCLLYFSSLQP